jgi:hypothetical protein
MGTLGDAVGPAVEAPSPDAEVVHTSAVYFIDPAGRERFIAALMQSLLIPTCRASFRAP